MKAHASSKPADLVSRVPSPVHHLLPHKNATVIAALGLFWLAFLAAAMGWLIWVCRVNPNISFLPEYSPAHWIVDPQPMTAIVQSIDPKPATFRHGLHLATRPAVAMLAVRCFRGGAVFVNGNPVELPLNQNWKKATEIDVATWLKPGENSFSVVVSNKIAPPALWFALRAPSVTLISDETWQVERPDGRFEVAHSAVRSPPIAPGDLLGGVERTPDALIRCWPRLGGFIAISVCLILGGRWWNQRANFSNHHDSLTGTAGSPAAGSEKSESLLTAVKMWRRWDPVCVCFGIVVGLWIGLLIHNLKLLSPGVGFDAYGHLDYVEYVQEHGSLPLADQGWEMHQPPLYYLICATVLNLAGLSGVTADGVRLIRWISLSIGLAHAAVILGLLRLLFPSQATKQLIGVALASFVPVQLYLSEYPTNESLAALLMGTTVLFSLRLVRAEPVSLNFSAYAAVGIYLGLALLTKLSALVLIPVVLTALLYSWWNCESGALRRWLFPLSSVLLCCAICGWHYWRVWRHFGHAFFPQTKFGYAVSWWQDPGYRTGAYFLNFGRCLRNPLFSGASGFADGLYSTFWGDGLCGGAGVLRERPRWNYELMAVGFVLALIPSALILVGFVSRAWKTIRRPEPMWLVVLAFSGIMLLAIFYFNLVAPSYAVAKAFYGLGALGCLCAFGVEGWSVLVGTSRRMAFIAANALLTWAIVAYLSFWCISA